MAPNGKSSPAPISAVSRGMAIAEYLAGRPAGATVSELGEALHIEISIVSRLLATLEAGDYVRRAPQAADHYVLGFKLAGLAYRHVSAFTIPEICMPVLQRLSRNVRELVQLALVDGDSVRIIAKADADQRVTLRGLVGHIARLDTMATGKVWLAWLSDEERLRVLAKSKSDVPVRDPPDLETLFRELREIRDDGYAIEIRSNVEDVGAIAAPVWAATPAQIVAVVTISGPAYRLDHQRLEQMAPDILEATREIAALWPAVLLRAHTTTEVLPEVPALAGAAE